MKYSTNPESGRALREQIEAAGKAPALGWHFARRVPIDLKHTDLRATFRRIKRIQNGS